jgi:hypothetical protein
MDYQGLWVLSGNFGVNNDLVTREVMDYEKYERFDCTTFYFANFL